MVGLWSVCRAPKKAPLFAPPGDLNCDCTEAEMNTLFNLPQPAHRSSDPKTSRRSAHDAKRFQRGHARLILEAMYDAARPMTAKAIGARCKPTLNNVQVCRRLSELGEAGLVAVWSEEGAERQHVLTEAGLEVAGGVDGR